MYGGLEASAAKRLKALEDQNAEEEVAIERSSH
jgi:hypothetical protein